MVHCRLEEKRNLADSEAKAAFSMPAVRTLGDRRNGGVRPTAHVPQYLPLFPTTRTVRHSRRPLHADRCKLRGNNCIKRILGYLAQLRTFLLVFFGRHCDQSSDHDEGLRASTSTDTLLCFPVYRNIPNRRFAVLSECLMKTDAFCIQ